MSIKDLSKNEMATYLYVRDIIQDEADMNNYFSIYDMMGTLLPIILIIIFILIVVLFYKTYGYEKNKEWFYDELELLVITLELLVIVFFFSNFCSNISTFSIKYLTAPYSV